MPASVIVNMMTVVHRSSNGISTAFPDVCKTPSPGGPIPIPYPNVAMSSDTAQGSKSVTMDGNPIMLQSSNYAMSTGDEAGSALGVVSNKIKGKAYPKMYSFDVKVDGKNVFRLLDIMLQNGGSPTNTPPAPNLQPPNVVIPLGRDPDECKVTKLSWDVTEARCGDEVKVSVETEKMNGMSTVVAAVRNAWTFRTVGLIPVTISGEKANPSWLVRRGPYQRTVKLKAKVASVGGPKESSNELEVKGVADVGPSLFSEQRTAYGMVWAYTPGYGHSWIGRNVYSWDVTYEREIKNGELIIRKKVQFAPLPHVVTGKRPPVLTRKVRARWKREIESVWDRKFRLHRVECKRGDACDCSECGGCSIPIRIFCEWGGGHGRPVKLFAGAPDAKDWGRPDLWWYSHTWWEKIGGGSVTVRAHEFGHLIGMYDEYPQGAVNPAAHGSKLLLDRRVEDRTSIMNSGSKVYARHLKEFQQWFESQASSVIGKTKLVRL